MKSISFQRDEAISFSAAAIALTLGIAANLCFGYLDWARSSNESGGERYEAVNFPIDVNAAEKEQLTLIPGIGPGLAARICEHRAKNGDFGTRCEIRRVSGVGPRLYEKIRDKIYVCADPTPDVDDPCELEEGKRSSAPRIDINAAPLGVFSGIKGIGAKIGMKIIAYRESSGGRIEKISDLSRIGGIGAKRLEKINEHFIVIK